MMLFSLLYFRKRERFKKKGHQCIKNQFPITLKTMNTKNSFISTCKSQNESVIQKLTVV